MTAEEAAEFIRPAVAPATGAWADLGAGEGTFTLALASLLAPGSSVLAVDQDAAALRRLERRLGRRRDHRNDDVRVVTVVGDFFAAATLPDALLAALSGALFANALHFDPHVEAVLGQWAQRVRPGGRIAVVEYDRRPPNPWVPYPVGLARLREAAEAAGLESPEAVAERPSSYGGVMYCAWLGVPGSA